MPRTIFKITFDREIKGWGAAGVFLFVYLGVYLGRLGLLAEHPSAFPASFLSLSPPLAPLLFRASLEKDYETLPWIRLMR